MLTANYTNNEAPHTPACPLLALFFFPTPVLLHSSPDPPHLALIFFFLTSLIYAYIPQNLFINVTFSLSDSPSPTIPLPRRVQFGGYILFNDVSYSLRHVIMSSKCTEELEEKMCW